MWERKKRKLVILLGREGQCKSTTYTTGAIIQCFTAISNNVRSKLRAYTTRPNGSMGRGRGLFHVLTEYY